MLSLQALLNILGFSAILLFFVLRSLPLTAITVRDLRLGSPHHRQIALDQHQCFPWSQNQRFTPWLPQPQLTRRKSHCFTHWPTNSSTPSKPSLPLAYEILLYFHNGLGAELAYAMASSCIFLLHWKLRGLNDIADIRTLTDAIGIA